MKWFLSISALALVAPLPGSALTLDFPASVTAVAEQAVPADSYFLATAPYTGDALTGIFAEGSVEHRTWRVGDGGLTTMQILSPLRDQLRSEGYAPLFECEDATCGGYDFRYQIDILSEPDMHVNLGDFRYFAAERPGADRPEYVCLIVSRSANAGFVQMTRVGAKTAPPIVASTKAISVPSLDVAVGSIGEKLESAGHATLDDLTFKPGSSQLGQESFLSLEGLAEYLSANPGRKVVLVGHTDAEGALDINIVLSRRRASAVMERLVYKLGVAPDQVSADGVGFLSPRASNLTEDGRHMNRRVEVILTSTQ